MGRENSAAWGDSPPHLSLLSGLMLMSYSKLRRNHSSSGDAGVILLKTCIVPIREMKGCSGLHVVLAHEQPSSCNF